MSFLPIKIPFNPNDNWVFYPSFVFMVLSMYLNFWQFWANGWMGTFYSNAIREFAIERFTQPVLWWLGVTAYLSLGELAFPLLGFLFFTISLIFLIQTFKAEHKIILLLLYIFLFIRPEAANWVMGFSRDALIFMISSIYTFYFSKVWLKKENHYLILLILSLFAMYTKSSGALLLWFLFIIFIRNNHNRIFEGGWLAVIPLWRPNWAYKAWLVDVQRIANSLLDMRHFNAAFLFPNPVFYISVLAALVLRRFTPFMIVITTLLSGVAVHNLSPHFYDLEVIWRYTYMLLPLNLLVIGQAVNKIVVFKKEKVRKSGKR